MKPICRSLLAALWLGLATLGRGADATVASPDSRLIRIATAHSALVLFPGDDGRLYQLAYGKAAALPSAPKRAPSREAEFHPQYGDGFTCEPALQVTHADGNTSTALAYVRRQTTALEAGVSLTRIELKDCFYPLWVTLCLKSCGQEDVIEQWTEIRHEEPGAVTLYRFASSAPVLKAKEYWLTQFQGDYSREAALVEERLGPGLKILDSKLGVRASRFRIPSFLLSLNAPAREEAGEVLGGSLCLVRQLSTRVRARLEQPSARLVRHQSFGLAIPPQARPDLHHAGDALDLERPAAKARSAAISTAGPAATAYATPPNPVPSC